MGTAAGVNEGMAAGAWTASWLAERRRFVAEVHDEAIRLKATIARELASLRVMLPEKYVERVDRLSAMVESGFHRLSTIVERWSEARVESLAIGVRLSERERQVLCAVAGGQTTKEISIALGIRPRTVETYRANLARKLGTSSIAGLTRFAIAHHLISDER